MTDTTGETPEPSAAGSRPSAPVAGARPTQARRVATRRVPAFRRIADQVEPYAAWWAEQNAAALEAEGPLWVVLGDSAAQGIGASHPSTGWVGALDGHLRRAGRTHRLVNLSVSGAWVADLVEEQLPRLEELAAAHGSAALVTVNIGGNDQYRGFRPTELRRQLEDLAPQLPTGTVVALLTLWPTARQTNAVIRRVADAHGLVVADVNRHYHWPYHRRTASDWFHPSDVGHADWALGFADALGCAPEVSSPGR